MEQKKQPFQPFLYRGSGPKRVIFCTYPSVYSDVVLDELLRVEEVEVVGAVLSTRVLNKNYNYFYSIWRQVRRSGLAYAIYLFVITGLYSVLLKVLGRGDLQLRLKKSRIPLLNTKDINDEESLAFVKDLQADVMLSAHFNQLVGAEILHTDGMSCLNIHPSLLPEYKGVDPAFYVLLRGELSTGVTIHFQGAEFDTGQTLEQVGVDISAEDSLLGLNLKLFRQGAAVAVRQIQSMSVGEKQLGKGGYDSWPAPVDVRIFRRSRKLFRWRELRSDSS